MTPLLKEHYTAVKIKRDKGDKQKVIFNARYLATLKFNEERTCWRNILLRDSETEELQ